MQAIWNIINTKAGVAIVTCVLTATFTILLNRWKIGREQKVRFENHIGDKITNAIIEIRELVIEANAYEVYDIDNILENEGKDFNVFNDVRNYPAIMNGQAEFCEFTNKINDARKNNEKYLDRETAAYLYYMNRYTLQLMIYIGDMGLNNDFPFVGTAFIHDFNKWVRAYDRVLVRKLNRSNCKIKCKSGFLWELTKKYVMGKLWKKSLLYELLNNPSNTINKIFEEYSKQINPTVDAK